MVSARRIFAAAIATWLLLLSASPARSVSDSGERAGGTSPTREWQTVTKLNFSSQIRLHPHVLLMITVPWSGESRSLMKELAHFVTDKQELGYLKLMVIYKNYEKMLADVLGASEGITLLYYHHSTSYKYLGQLLTQNILSSIYHIMSLQTDEVPLKSLRTREDLDNFFQSTDKAVLLLEFCGWSTKLKNRKTDENKITTSVEGTPEKGFLDENLTREGGKLEINLLEDQKGKKIEELTHGIQSGLDVSPWLGRFTLANQSVPQGTEYRNASKEMLCTEEEFHQFKSFFSNFTKIAREHFLPPERQRFGLISDRSLLPFLGVSNIETWLVTLHFSGCPNFSMVLQKGDDLRKLLQMDNPLVTELHVDERSLESTFPANRPSVILFIDRSSDSSKVRGDSKFALQVLRKYARGNQLSYKTAWGPESPQCSLKEVRLKTWSHTLSGHQTTEDALAQKILKFNDNNASMIMNDGESISLDRPAETQGNIYDILAHLLNRKKPGLGAKEKKISLVAKEAGFQLLSDDFDVQITDSPSHKENYPSKDIDDSVTSLEDQTSQVHEEPYVNNVVDKDILVDAAVIAALDDEKKPEFTDTETFLEQDQKKIIFTESDTSDDESKVEVGSFTSQVDENNGNCKQEDSQPFTCSAENSVEKGSITKERSTEKHRIDTTDSSSKKRIYSESKQTLAHVFPREALVEDEAGELVNVIKPSRLDEWHLQKIPFKGSFFFSDGGYQLLQSLTGGRKVPSLVILDPVLQQHFVFSEEIDISYFSLVSFIENFLNGSLTPYRRSALPIMSSRGAPRPPFVNLDFHEVDSIPLVTVNTFCQLVVGYKPCQMGDEIQFSHIPSFTPVWKKDVLVLFSTPSCGFCQRMELIVREVHRAFLNLSALLKRNSKKVDAMHIQDDTKDTMIDGPPSVFLMDCMLNDCGSLLKSMDKKEVYPALMLFPAENKSAIMYGGDVSVVNIIEFLVSHGRNSRFLVRHKGILWTHSWVGSKRHATLQDSSSSVDQVEATPAEKYNELSTATEVDNPPPISSQGDDITIGSVLAATDKLRNAVPFDNSTVIIVTANENQGFQGLIMNKRISWDVFGELDEDLKPLKQAPLSYGGPVRVDGLPLVSLTRKAKEGFKNVSGSIYYGDPVATGLKIEGIKSGDESAYDYWFFLGYCSWYWNQLFDEFAEGAWHLSESSIGHLDWPR